MSLAQVVGHRRLVTLLSRAVARATLPPALLLAGPAGVGKKRVALALAQAINCTSPKTDGGLERDACGACPSCRRIARGIHPDVIVVEPGDTGVDQDRARSGTSSRRRAAGRSRRAGAW